jgi:hypothetical protein
MKHRLLDPLESCALEFKGEFRLFGICSISVTIDIDRSILRVSRRERIWPVYREKAVSGNSSLGRHAKRKSHTVLGD